MADKLAYKVLMSTTGEMMDVSEYLMDADIRQRTNNVSSARFTLIDKNKEFENEIAPTKTYDIVFSASLDGGHNWHRKFFGLVEKYNIVVEADGARTVEIECFGGQGLRYSYMSPNQTAIGEYESFSSLFMGTPTATDGTAWGTDSFGNYPNGLLYDTGYSYSGVTDYYPDGVLDIPTRVGYGSRKKLDAIRSYLEPFGAQFFTIETGGTPVFVTRKNPLLEGFSSPVATFTVGKDVNTYNREVELRSTRELVTLIGADPSVWAQIGSGTFEEFLRDGDLYDVASAYMNANLLHSISQAPLETCMLVVSPVTGTSPLGYSVAIKDTDGTSITRSVIGVSENFKPDRWTTEIQLERPALDTVNTVTEVMQSFSLMETDDMRNSVYIRLTMGATPFYDAYECNNIIAYGVGIGTLSTPTDSSTLVEPILFHGISNYYDEDADFIRGEDAPIAPHIWAELSSVQGNRLIREFGLYANDLTGGAAYVVTESFAWNRPTVEWSSSGLANIGILNDGRYMLSLEDIRYESQLGAGYAVYPMPMKDARGFWLDSFSDTLPTNIPLPTESSDWNNTDLSLEYTADEKTKMSRDLVKDTPAFDCFTATGENNAVTFVTPVSLFKFRVPFKFNATTAKPLVDRYVENVRIIAVYRGSASLGGSPYDAAVSMSVCSISDDLGTRAWVGSNSANWGVSSSNMEVRTISLDTASTGVPISRWVDENGYLNVCLWNPQYGALKGQYSQLVSFISAVWDIKPMPSSSQGLNTVFEFVKFIKSNGSFMFTLPPRNIIGMWVSASATEFGYMPIGTDLSTWFNPGDLQFEGEEFVWDIINEDQFPQKTAQYVPGSHKMPENLGPDIATGWLYDEYLLASTVLDDTLALRTIAKQGGAWIAYETRASWEINAPKKLSTDMASLSFNAGDGGKSMLASMSMWSAPPYGVNLAFVYRCVGTDGTNGGCIGRVLLTSSGDMSNSSIREGFDKNEMRSAYLLFDWTSLSAYNIFYTGAGGKFRAW